MIEIYSKEMEINSNREFIKSISNDLNNNYIYFECLNGENINSEKDIFKNRILERISNELINKRDSEFSYQTVEYNGMITRVRDKDVVVISSLSLVGGTYIFENGDSELSTEQAKELLSLVNAKRTIIIQRKLELESIISELDLYDLERFNVYCEW